jgi:AcrR family transcriptional regulator
MSTSPDITPSRPLRSDAVRNRRRVLEAARELFAERGLGVTLIEIAQRAGVGVGTVHRRFPDRAELLEDLFDGRLDELAELAHTALADRDPWHGLVWFLEQSAEMQAADRGLMELLNDASGELAHLCCIRAKLDPTSAELLQRAKDAGQVRDDVSTDDLPMIQAIMCTVIGASRDVDPNLWRRYLALLARGLSARPELIKLDHAPPELDAVGTGPRSGSTSTC